MKQTKQPTRLQEELLPGAESSTEAFPEAVEVLYPCTQPVAQSVKWE